MTAATHRTDQPADLSDVPWWRHAVIYQIYPRSWADSDGDGVGDLPGITARLPYLRTLGVDAVWLSPFYVSPMADAGYDVADYTEVDPVFGALGDADALIDRAHALGLKVIVDLVPNHTSDEHEWFQAALAAGPGSPERQRYIFREGRGPSGEEPPNNWRSVFGGPAWTRLTEADGTPGQWYLHLFDRKQPDLNWAEPEVRQMFVGVLRFWLDRGADGFRVDVAHGLVKAPGLPDWHERTTMLGAREDGAAGQHGSPGGPTTGPVVDDETDPEHRPPMWDQDGVHEIYRQWRAVLEQYNPQGEPGADRILVAEAWVDPVERAVAYVRSDEMHQAFNFDFLECPWRAADLREVIDHSLRAAGMVGAPSTWVLSNHDVVRHSSRLGMPVGRRRPNGIGIGDAQPNAVLGLRRARAATALMLALPGSAYVYQGEELGLPEHTALPDEVRQDPTWERSSGAERGRDGCRVPFPWEAGAPSYGFGPDGRSWLPQPEIYGVLAVDRQDGVPGSTLTLYRTLLTARRELSMGTGKLEWLPDQPGDVVAFRVRTAHGEVAVVTNLAQAPYPLPDGAEVVLSSGPWDLDSRTVPTDTTVWLRLPR